MGFLSSHYEEAGLLVSHGPEALLERPRSFYAWSLSSEGTL